MKKIFKRNLSIFSILMSTILVIPMSFISVSSVAGEEVLTGNQQNKIWIDNNDGENFASINEAVQQASDGATIHVSGIFKDSTNLAGTTISKNITLDVVADTTMIGDGSANGITLKSGSHLRTGKGVSLTLQKFKTALIIEAGAELNDGNYKLLDNLDGTRGLDIRGGVKGSTDKNSVILSADDANNSDFYSAGATFANATITVKSKTQTWFDTASLVTDNVNMEMIGFGQGYYLGGGTSIKNSKITFTGGQKCHFICLDASTGASFQGGNSSIVGSEIIMNYGLTAGLSIGLNSKDTILNIKDSVIVFNNSGMGGLNINTGTVNFDNSKIISNGKQNNLVYGVQPNGLLNIYNSSDIQTAARKNSDNGGATDNNYVVTGGTFAIKYAPDYYSNLGSTIPVNGEANGNEKLTYVTLADVNTNSITVLNSLGNTYEYNVLTASPDGEKHVWVPTVNVTFQKGSATAKFADDSTDDKILQAIRGNKLSLIKDVAIPANPVNSDQTAIFKGWFYQENGQEQKFTPDTAINKDLTVYAKWEKIDTVTMNLNLYGDLLLGDDTEHDNVPVVKNKDLLTIKGKMDISSIKKQIAIMATNYGGDVNDISLKNIESVFVANLTLPAGLSFKAGSKVELTDNDVFAIKSDEINGQTLKVTMSLKKDYTEFSDLYRDITEIPVDFFEIIVKNVEVTDGAPDAAFLTIEGNVSGSFNGIAYSQDKFKAYDFTWNAIQLPDGKDKMQTGGDKIQLTLKIDNPQILVENFSIDGDILIGDNTGHDKILEVKPGAELAYTGRLFINSIVDKINAYANNYINAGTQGTPGCTLEQIALTDTASTFIATVSFPDDMIIPDNVQAVLTDNVLFAVSKTEKSGNNIKITMELKKTYDKFSSLYEDVNKVGKNLFLEVTVPDIKVKSDAKIGEILTVKGSVAGEFLSKARCTKSGKAKNYNFTWSAKQYLGGVSKDGKIYENGKDANQSKDDDETIAFTVKVGEDKSDHGYFIPTTDLYDDNKAVGKIDTTVENTVKAKNFPRTGEANNLGKQLLTVVLATMMLVCWLKAIKKRVSQAD